MSKTPSKELTVTLSLFSIKHHVPLTDLYLTHQSPLVFSERVVNMFAITADPLLNTLISSDGVQRTLSLV